MKVRTVGILFAGTVVLAVACTNGEGEPGTTPGAPNVDQDAGSAGETSVGGTHSSAGKGGTGSAGKPTKSDDAGAPSSTGGTRASGHGGSSTDSSGGDSSNTNSSGGTSHHGSSGSAGEADAGAPSNAGGNAGESGSGGNGGEAGDSSPAGTIPYVAVTYTYVADDDWNGLSIYQEAQDGHGHTLSRPPPYGPENPVPAVLGTFAWRIAGDDPGTSCSSQNDSTVTCTVHVPSGATVSVNVHQTQPGLGLWACDINGVQSGTFTVKDGDGVRLALASTTNVPSDVTAVPCVFQYVAP